MQKKSIYILLTIIAVLVVGKLLWFTTERSPERSINPITPTPQNQAITPPTPEPTVVSTTVRLPLPIDADMPELSTFYVIPSSTIAWLGRKTLIADYADHGTIPVKDSTVTIKDTGIEGKLVFDVSGLKAVSTGKHMGESMLENHLKSDAFFNVQAFPSAEFIITRALPTDSVSTSHMYLVKGKLTIKGITNDIEFPAAIYMQKGELHAKAAFDLDRTKWDIRYGSNKFFDNLADNVIDDMFTVSFDLTAQTSRWE